MSFYTYEKNDVEAKILQYCGERCLATEGRIDEIEDAIAIHNT